MDHPARRHDLDWLRIAAFGLLIAYHVGMFYVSWEWHVKSDHASTWIEPAMLLLNPWRLGLLFFISGVATRFLADRSKPTAFITNRFHRLFWPLLFAILVIVPPQSFGEVVQKHGFSGGYLEFYAKYLSGYGGWGLTLPTWNHMWFVAYLLVYSLALLPIWLIARKFNPPRLPAWIFLLLPFLYLWLVRAALAPAFPSTHALVDDWYNHATYFPLFLLGFFIAKDPRPFAVAAKARWPALAIALAAWMALWALRASIANPADVSLSVWGLASGLRELQAWAAIVALIGFAHRHLAHRDGPWRRTLTEAVFPFYVIHQTIIVAVAPLIDRQSWPVALEGALLVTVTIAGCGAFYLLARHSGPLRIVLGLNPTPRPAPKHAARSSPPHSSE